MNIYPTTKISKKSSCLNESEKLRNTCKELLKKEKKPENYKHYIMAMIVNSGFLWNYRNCGFDYFQYCYEKYKKINKTYKTILEDIIFALFIFDKIDEFKTEILRTITKDIPQEYSVPMIYYSLKKFPTNENTEECIELYKLYLGEKYNESLKDNFGYMTWRVQEELEKFFYETTSRNLSILKSPLNIKEITGKKKISIGKGEFAINIMTEKEKKDFKNKLGFDDISLKYLDQSDYQYFKNKLQKISGQDQAYVTLFIRTFFDYVIRKSLYLYENNKLLDPIDIERKVGTLSKNNNNIFYKNLKLVKEKGNIFRIVNRYNSNTILFLAYLTVPYNTIKNIINNNSSKYQVWGIYHGVKKKKDLLIPDGIILSDNENNTVVKINSYKDDYLDAYLFCSLLIDDELKVEKNIPMTNSEIIYYDKPFGNFRCEKGNTSCNSVSVVDVDMGGQGTFINVYKGERDKCKIFGGKEISGDSVKEYKFYSELFRRTDLSDEMREFKKLIPKYYGTISCNEKRYMILENLKDIRGDPRTIQTLDFKLGRDTALLFDKGIYGKSRHIVLNKVITTSSEKGYRLESATGCMVYTSKEDKCPSDKKLNNTIIELADRSVIGIKKWKLMDIEMQYIMEAFFMNSSEKLKQKLKEKLEKISKLREDNSEFGFIGSSILIIKSNMDIDVKLIDFGHPFWRRSDCCSDKSQKNIEKVIDNYNNGLQSFIGDFISWLQPNK